MSNMVCTDVHVNEAVFIPPSDPTPSHVLKLSAIDSQLFLRFTIEYLFIYRPTRCHYAASDRTATVARVKNALARALVPYYPLAGRVRARSDGSCLEVVCCGQGAVFVEATGECSVADFERAPRFVTEWRNFLAVDLTADVVKGAPLLVVQLTWLSDGSTAVGVGFSHCICDGIGSVQFLNYFTKLASNFDRYYRSEVDADPKPVWDRHLLDPTSYRLQTNQTRDKHPEFNRVVDVSKFLTRFNPDQLTPTATTFHERRINELKTIIASTSQLGISSATSFEAVSAHIWRSWARALNLPPQQTLKLLFPINIRKRLKPSLPNGFYGNAIVLGCAQTTARQLCGNGLGYTVELIREAKNRVNNGFIREVVESVSLTQPSHVDSVGVLILSQWSKLGLENVDFGFGRPVQVCPVCTDKYCILLPVQDHSRSVKSVLAVPTEVVGRYEHLIRAME